MESKKKKGLQNNYFEVPNEIFEIDLGPYELAVYCYLFRCSNQGADAYPSYKTIGEKCGMTRRAAINVVGKLTNHGLIFKRSKGRGKTNQFQVFRPGGESRLPGSEIGSPPVVNQVHPIKNSLIKNKDKEKTGSALSDCRLSFHEYTAENEINEKTRAVIEYILEQFKNKISVEEKLTVKEWEIAFQKVKREDADQVDFYIEKSATGKYKAPPGLLHFLSPGVNEILFREGLRHERKFD